MLNTTAVKIDQNNDEPYPDVARLEPVYRGQRPHQGILHQIVGNLSIAHQTLRKPAQARYFADELVAQIDHSGQRLPLDLANMRSLGIVPVDAIADPLCPTT